MSVQWTEDQKKVIELRNRNILVSAGVLSLLEELLLSPPQAVRARAMVRARIALIHLLLILSPSCPAFFFPAGEE